MGRRRRIFCCDKDRGDYFILAEFMEVLQVQGIVQDLVYIHFQDFGFTDFEFNTENDAPVE